MENSFLIDIEAYAVNYITRNISKDYKFHDIQHTISVVESVQILGKEMNLSAEDLELLVIAAWFHDMGYDQGAEGHELRSCTYAEKYLTEHHYPVEKIDTVKNCIMATRLTATPETVLEKIICDADLSHLGKRHYWDRCAKIREEAEKTKGVVMTEDEWINFELGFMQGHHYNTSAAKELFDERKEKHIQKLERNQLKLQDPERAALLKATKKKKKRNKIDLTQVQNPSSINLKQIDLGRGVETMYRTTYRTHINLSSIADNKANIMLSINAIIVSITLSSLVPRFGDTPKLIIPTVVLLAVCLVAIIFATLSTRPKITEGKFTRKDIEERKSNLLFFGNFYNMSLDDYNWGMLEMIKDEDFLYSSMTRDLYFLGIVLAKKYRYLSYCYAIFMYGLIITVLTFGVTFLFF